MIQYEDDSNSNQIANFIYEKQNNIQTCYRLCPTEFEQISAFVSKIFDKNQSSDDFIISVYNNKSISGIACFTVEKEDKYLECIGGFFDSYVDFTSILKQLRADYKGFTLDFVIRPENEVLSKWLLKNGGIFDELEYCYRIEEHPVIFTEPTNVKVVELNNNESDYIQQYRQIHNDEERYWTAQRVLDASDIFKIFGLVENNKLVGYVDIACKADPVEIYDLKIINTDYYNEYCQHLLGIALTKIFTVRNIKSVIVLVEESNTNLIKIYSDIGGVIYDKSRNIRILL
jgi:hypothetical protein